MSIPLGTTAAQSPLIVQAMTRNSREPSPLEALLLSGSHPLTQAALSPGLSYLSSIGSLPVSQMGQHAHSYTTINDVLSAQLQLQLQQLQPTSPIVDNQHARPAITPASPHYLDVASPNAMDFMDSPRTVEYLNRGSESIGPDDTVAKVVDSSLPDNTLIDRPDEQSATEVWRMFNRAKERLTQSSRVENLAWRIMSLSLKRKHRDDNDDNSHISSNSNDDVSISYGNTAIRGASAPANDIQARDTAYRTSAPTSAYATTQSHYHQHDTVSLLEQRSMSMADIRHVATNASSSYQQQNEARIIAKPVKPSLQRKKPNMTRSQTADNMNAYSLQRLGSSITIPADDSDDMTATPFASHPTMPTPSGTSMASSLISNLSESMTATNPATLDGLDNTALLSSIASLSNFPFTFQLSSSDQHKYTGHDNIQSTASLSMSTSSSASMSNMIPSELMNHDISFNVIANPITNALFNQIHHTNRTTTTTTTAAAAVNHSNNHFTNSDNNINNTLSTPSTSTTTATTTTTTDSNRIINGVGRGGGSGDGGGGDDVGEETVDSVVKTMDDENTTAAATAESISNTSHTNDDKSSDLTCKNCETTVTPLWRRDPEGNPLCNACGLFLKLHGVLRPKSLKASVIKKRNRRPRPVAVAHTSHIRPAPPNYHPHPHPHQQHHYPMNYTSSHLSHNDTLSSQAKRVRTNEPTTGYHLTAQPLDSSSESRQSVALAIAERLHNQRVLAAARLAAERMSRAEERHGNYYVGHALAPTEESMETDVVSGFWFHNIPQYNNDNFAEYDDKSSSKDDVEMQ